MKFGQHRW